MTPERKRQFEQRTNDDGTPEDVYEWISRQIAMARVRELVWLYLLRSSDEPQQRAMELAVQAKVAYWTRFATMVALFTSTVAIIVAIVALAAS